MSWQQHVVVTETTRWQHPQAGLVLDMSRDVSTPRPLALGQSKAEKLPRRAVMELQALLCARFAHRGHGLRNGLRNLLEEFDYQLPLWIGSCMSVF